MSIRERLYRAIARLDVGHPWLVLAIAAALAAASVWYTKARLEFQTGQEDLIRDSSSDTRNYHAYEREFPDLDGLIVIVRAQPDYARAEKFADTLASRLAADRVNVKSVFYKIDPAAFAGTALLYLNRDEIAGLARNLREHRELLKRYASAPTLENLFELVNDEADRAMVSHMMGGLLGGAGSGADSGAPDLSFVDAVLDGMLSAKGDRAELPWDRLTSPRENEGALRDGYLATENGKYLLMNVAPGDGVDGGPDPVDAIQDHLDAVRAGLPDVEAGMTGGPALARAEQHSSERDIALASVLAIVGNVLLIVIPFGGVVEPAFALAALLVGVAWSFGFTTAAVGHLNLLSAIFTSVLAGIGINFPIHLMARYDEARRAGRSMPEALELAVVNTGAGVVASATIMALAFLMPVFSGFRGIAELGLVSAAGLFCCLISAMTVFPALVAIRDRGRESAARPAASDATRDTRLDRLYSRPKIIVAAAVGAAALAPLFVRNLTFDQNLLKLQAESAEAVQFEGKLLHDSGRSTWFAVALAQSSAEAERKAAAFRRLPEVAEADTIATYIPDGQAEKRALLAALKPELDSIRPASLAAPSDPAKLGRELESLRFKLGSARDESIEKTEAMVADAVDRLKEDPHAFDSYERRMADGLGAKLADFRRALDPGEVTEANLPAVLRDRFIGRTGKFLVQIYPRGDVWDDAPLARFVGALKSVDADVTGPPVQTWAIARIMRRGYERAGVLALIAVFVFVLADFRSLRDTALATVPLVFGGAWLLGAMGIVGWEFNLANLFAVPIIIGTGVDNGVNMLYRWREERVKSRLILDVAVGKSVTIASLTTIAGFAALIPAAHRGISSLGWVLSAGVAFILLATVAVLPAMLELVGRRIERVRARRGARVTPITSRRRTGMFVLAAAMVLPAMLAASSRALAGEDRSARAASDQLVGQAEALVAQAGQRDPVDSALVRQAIDKLHEAVKIDPRNDSAFVDLGFCYSVLRDAETAVEMYRRATQINPSGPNFKELADIYLRVGDPDDALLAANAGIVKDPKNARLYNAKGMALNDLARFDEAAEAFQKAIDLDPSLAVARANLAALNGGSRGRGTIAKHRKSAAAGQ